MNRIERIALNNLVLQTEIQELENEVKELNKYIEDFKERLEKSESVNREMQVKIWELETDLAYENRRHLFYATKFEQLLLQDKNKKYRVYMS